MLVYTYDKAKGCRVSFAWSIQNSMVGQCRPTAYLDQSLWISNRTKSMEQRQLEH